ncbi:MAG TPA: glycerophosphodiester phosphodiesterase family protein [Blastocatellia bacterium]|nr:glycerophosphodiester phosphodiesterase family protein [Blastocatellia bacterium]
MKRFFKAFPLGTIAAIPALAMVLSGLLATGPSFGLSASVQDVPRSAHPMVIAHRGGSKESTENTIGAFQRAARIGADGIETDIRLTRDGVVVVYHDDYFGRVEGLAPPLRTRLISDMTYPELTRQTLVPVGEDKGGRHIPKLDDLLSQVKGVLLNIELKRCARFDELVHKTILSLRKFPELDRVVLEAPDLETAHKLREGLGPGIKLHINPGYDDSVPFSVALEHVLKFKPHSISVSYKKMSMDVAEAAHKAGVEVWVWTVDSPEVARAMATLGADAIKTDRPAALLEVFGRRV